MKPKKMKRRTGMAVCAFALASIAPAAWVQAEDAKTGATSGASSGTGTDTRTETRSGASGATSSGASSDTSSGASRSSSSASGQSNDTMQQINNATQVVKRMESDPQVQKLLQQAEGVFIVPQYGRGGLTVGVRGGEGVLLVNNNGKWSNPVFYNFGGLSVGAQAGAEVGSIAMMLMNQKAVNSFMQDNQFSLTADAGLTIVDYTAKAQATAGRGDVIIWSDTKGAFAGAVVGVTDVNFDDDENQTFYKSKVSAKDILGGKVKSAQATPLTRELSSGR